MEDLSVVLNEMLSIIREELDVTQVELAKRLNCSQELISKIENKNRELSYELIFTLSSLSKVDLHFFRYISSKFKTTEDYLLFAELSNLIDSDVSGNINRIEELNNKNPLTESRDYGDLNAILYYSEIVVAYYKYQDYHKVIRIALKACEWENKKIKTDYIKSLKLGYYYGIYSMLVKAHVKVGYVDTALMFTDMFFKHFKEVWSDKRFTMVTDRYVYRKFYIGINVGHIMAKYAMKDYEEVITLSEALLKELKKFNLLIEAEEIIALKAKSLVRLNRNDEAEEIITDLKVICKYLDKNDFYESFKRELLMQ
ncbi:MAG: helix-turn-helix domain-containing protein [Lachnospirales bacterium]